MELSCLFCERPIITEKYGVIHCKECNYSFCYEPPIKIMERKLDLTGIEDSSHNLTSLCLIDEILDKKIEYPHCFLQHIYKDEKDKSTFLTCLNKNFKIGHVNFTVGNSFATSYRFGLIIDNIYNFLSQVIDYSECDILVFHHIVIDFMNIREKNMVESLVKALYEQKKLINNKTLILCTIPETRASTVWYKAMLDNEKLQLKTSASS